MSQTPNPAADPGQPMIYEVRIQGHLSNRWEAWFEHMTITPEANGITLLTGPIVDQAALHGMLTRVRDLGLPLLSVTRIAPTHNEPMNALNTTRRKETA
jgi:hypothetical protein